MIPSMVLIAGMRYEVVEKEMKDQEAQIIHSRQVIELNKDMSPEYKARVLLHEIIAGIYKEFGLPAAGKARNVNALTAGLWDFMRNNDMGFIGMNPPVLSVIDPANFNPEDVTEVFEEPFADVTHTLFPEMTEPEIVEPKVQVVSVGKYEHVDEGIEEDDGRFRLGEMARIKKAHKEVAADVEEKVKEEEAPQPQEHWYTGIKVKEGGTEYYQTRYECPCGSKGKRFIREDDPICICHHCGEELEKVPATPNGFPDRDYFGNFFFAKKPYLDD